jgi:hypothetical protein
MKSSIFWDITPCSLLAICFMLVSCSACSSTLKLEATYFSETLVVFQRITLRYIPKDKILHE